MQTTIIESNTINRASVEKLTLNDIAGYAEEKAEALKIINLFKNYEKLSSLGISLPKGLILSGCPGVGKTLMAKVIASESNVPLFTYEEDENDEESGLKNLYARARENTPCIVFIDELDKICALDDYMTDMSRLELKNLLSEIDGIKSNNGVLTIATVNNYDSIPSSLKRSGRMDKHIHFDLPNLEAREAILNLYITPKSNIIDANPKDIAYKTQGFSGADLKTLINETLLDVVSTGGSMAYSKDFFRTIPLIAMKGIRKSSDSDCNDRQVIYHELGHFVCEYKLNNNFSSISIEKIGQVEGYISPIRRMRQMSTSRSISSATELKNRCIVALGGYVAERIFLGETYDGVGADFETFAATISWMGHCGMLGEQYIFQDDTKVMKYQGGIATLPSDELTNMQTIFFREYSKIAEDIIRSNTGLIEYLYGELLDRRTLESEEVEDLITKYNESQVGAPC